MSLPPSELFRFAVTRAPREDLPENGIDPPEDTTFATYAMRRAPEKPQPALAKVALAWLKGKEALQYSADTPLILAAGIAAASLQDALATDAGSPANVLNLIKESGFREARGNLNAKQALDRLWSTLTALHCAPVADVGAMLGLTRALRVQIIDSAASTAGFDLARLLRAPLKLPLSAVRAAYLAAPDKPVAPPPAAPLALELKQRQRAEGQKLVALHAVLEKAQRVRREREFAAKPLKNPQVPLSAAELKGFSAAEKNLLASTGAQAAPLTILLAQLGASVAAQASRVTDIGRTSYKPAVKVLQSKSEEVHTTRAALVQLQIGGLLPWLGPWSFIPAVIDAVDPDIYTVPSNDELAEGLLPRVRPIGVMDLKLVETSLQRYQLGEVAHVENVLASEYRKRVHKRQDTTEETTLLETQTSRESERNLESTERFEMKKEVSNTISEQMQFTAGVQVSVSGPCFSVGANAGFSYGRSSEQAEKFSSDYSKEVVEKTREKVETRVREVRQTLRRVVVEEGNTHRFDNTADGAGHVVGIYRYVDKVVQARLLNYGRRMMFEFMVPEPGAALRAVERQASGKPAALPELDIGPADLDETNYQHYAGLFGAREIEAPPPLRTEVATVLARNSSSPPGDGTAASPVLLSSDIDVPDGYEATGYRLTFACTGLVEPIDLLWCVGDYPGRYLVVDSGTSTWQSMHHTFDGARLGSTIPAWLLIGTSKQAIASVTLECRRQSGCWETWQNKTYTKIKEAYEIRLADTVDANRRLEGQQRRGVTSPNPQINRRREREELTRGCINMVNSMLLQGDYFDSMRVTDSGIIVDVDDALREGQTVRFFQGAFEWDNMTYELFPYFWGKRERWSEMMLATHEDAKYEEFLRSGFSRVMVPVRPGQEHNVLNFLSMGLTAVFDGAAECVIDDEDFLRLLADVEAPLDPPVQEGEPWEVVVPTTLVKLQLEGEEGTLGIRGTA